MYNLEDPAIGYAMATGYGPPQPSIWSPFSGDDENEREDDEDGDR